MVIRLAMRKLLEIAARRIDAPDVVLAVASRQPEIEHQIPAVGAGIGVAARLAFLSGDGAFRASCRIDAIQNRVLIGDEESIARPSEIGLGVGRSEIMPLRAGSGMQASQKYSTGFRSIP